MTLNRSIASMRHARVGAHSAVRSHLLPVEHFAGLALALAPLQVFLFSFAGVYMAVYMILVFVLLLEMLRSGYYYTSTAGFLLISLLLGIQLISGTWSPDPVMAVREVVYSGAFLLFYAFASYAANGRTFAIVRSLKLFSIVTAFHAIIVIIFFLLPDVEARFLQSGIAPIFINPNGLNSYFFDVGNNVSDPWKSGGFFLNANTGAVLSETAAFISVALTQYGKRSRWAAVAALHFCAALLSGSKSALALVFVSPIIFYYLINFFAVKITRGKTIFMILGLLVIAISGYYIIEYLNTLDISDDAQINAYRRQVIWTFALQQFWDSPFLGLGFGGWSEKFASYGYAYMDIGLTEFMPPHNSLIYYWAQSGLIAPVLALGFIGYSFARIFLAARQRRTYLLSWAAACCFFNFFVHSLGENFTFFNEPHLQGPLAIFLGWASWSKRSSVRS